MYPDMFWVEYPDRKFLPPRTPIMFVFSFSIHTVNLANAAIENFEKTFQKDSNFSIVNNANYLIS